MGSVISGLSFKRYGQQIRSRQGSTVYCCRCFFIAQSYVLVKKWSEALVLYERVLKYAGEVQSGAGAFTNSLKVGTQSCVQSGAEVNEKALAQYLLSIRHQAIKIQG